MFHFSTRMCQEVEAAGERVYDCGCNPPLSGCYRNHRGIQTDLCDNRREGIDVILKRNSVQEI